MTPEDQLQVREIIRQELSRLIMADRFYFDKDIFLMDGKNFVFSAGTGVKIGTSSAQKIAFHGATPVIQASHIADPSGGATVDTIARSAINDILVVLENKGFTATS